MRPNGQVLTRDVCCAPARFAGAMLQAWARESAPGARRYTEHHARDCVAKAHARLRRMEAALAWLERFARCIAPEYRRIWRAERIPRAVAKQLTRLPASSSLLLQADGRLFFAPTVVPAYAAEQRKWLAGQREQLNYALAAFYLVREPLC